MSDQFKIPDKFANPEWATFCDVRKPKFKVHSTLGQAKNAIGVKKPHSAIQLLHFEEGEWRVQWEYTLSIYCDRCHGSFNNTYGYPTRNLPHREFREPVMDSEVICDLCYYAESDLISKARQEERDRQEYNRLKTKFEGMHE